MRRLSTPLFVAVALAASAASAGAQTPTLETLMSTPFPSAMTGSPDGRALAWIQDDEGARNIWIATSPSWQARMATAYTRDDGVEIGALTWTPDGSRLVFTRGGASNRAGEYANPTHDPEGGQSSMWRLAASGGEAVRLGGGGGSIAVAPAGDRIAFSRGGQLLFQSLTAGDAETVARVRGGVASITWSPDGRSIAFVSSRGTHAFIGVYDVDAKTVRFLDPSVDTDHSPVWSPDGGRLAWIREPASLALTLFRPVREAMPWSIRIADIKTGETREAWRAKEGRGSAFSGNVAAAQLMWTADDRLVFPWEATGWRLLYSIAPAGGTPTLLTPGEFEVEYVALGPDRKSIYYNANAGDIDRRDLFRVSATSGKPERLTSTDAIEWDPAPLAGGAMAWLRSDGHLPAHAVISTGGAERLLDPHALDGFPADALVEPEQVIYSSADGMRIHAQLFRPKNARAGEKHPALVHMHGGSRRQMVLGWHYNAYYHNAYAMNQYLASQGYVVLSINYRSGTGYGLDFREAEDYGAAGGAEFRDVMGAGLYLRSRAEVDPDRIGLWGGSYGGYLTAMGLSRASDLFKAGVDFHGVHDWNVGIATFVPSYDPKDDPEAAGLAFNASPMSSLAGWRSPVLVIHGDDDRNVRFIETIALVEKLRQQGVHVEQLVFPDEVHGFLMHSSWVRAYRATADFFSRELRDSHR